MKLTREELFRKLLHFFALLIPAGIYYVPYIFKLSKWLPAYVLGCLMAVSIFIETARRENSFVQKYFLKFFLIMMRKNEIKSFTGSTYIIASGFICSVVFVNRPEVSFISLFSFILGDAAAAIIGIEFGRIRIRGKSIEGFLACFAVVFLLNFYLFPKLPYIMENFAGAFSLQACFKISFLVSILEFYSIRVFNIEINDNLYVPVLCGLAILFV
ncbi:MAG: hypothetical protein CSB21_03575 [Deltaproteobacteria bacterium]|nr:MAG: hypothetical protein CSB21_03575 [Deltaproteobacteria bacterium]